MFPTMLSWVLLEWAENISFNISTLISTVMTLKTIFRYFHVSGKVEKNLFYISLVLMHFGLAGSGYFVYWQYFESAKIEFLTWKYLRPLWILFMYLFNTFPPVYMFFRLFFLKRKVRKGQKNNASENGSVFLVLLVAQIVNTILRAVLEYLVSYSNALQTENNMLAMTGPMSLLDVVHYALTYFLNFNLIQMIHSKLRPSEKPLKASTVIKKFVHTISFNKSS
jgi:hypothetical protein